MRHNRNIALAFSSWMALFPQLRMHGYKRIGELLSFPTVIETRAVSANIRLSGLRTSLKIWKALKKEYNHIFSHFCPLNKQVSFYCSLEMHKTFRIPFQFPDF